MKKSQVDKFVHYDVVIYAARGSSGARRLATALGSRRWRDDLPTRYTRRRPYFRGNSSPLVINWGSSIHPKWLDDARFRLNPVYVNHGEHVKKAINKLDFFQHASRINGVPLLKWTDQRDTAAEWIGKGKPVLCRTKLGGSSGDGIVLAKSTEELVEAPLYTRYYPKTHEFRVHVFNGEVIDLTQKKLKGGPDVRSSANSLVRSHDHGWVHAHDGIILTEDGRRQIGAACILCLSGLNLDLGAVDVLAILEPPNQEGIRTIKSFVICEVNTGPGLENTQTIEAYKKAILQLKEAGKLKNNNIQVDVSENKNDEYNMEGLPGNQPERSVPAEPQQ